LLWAPTLDSFFNLDHFRQPGENRLPAPFPKWHEASLVEAQKYIGGLDDYFSDHFGFRKQLIRWFQNWKIGLFHDRSVYKVLIGPNHWLFIGEQQMVEHYLGIMKFTPQQLQAWQRVLEKRRDWLAARGVKYLFVLAPDKQDIYPEELPAWLRNAAPASRETKLDQFLKYMQEHSTVEILDLRPPLLAAKKIAPTYLQNDTHWNWFGGFVACQEVIKTLTKQFPDLPPLRLEDFTWTNMPATSGDLARMLGSDAPEKNYFTFKPKPSASSRRCVRRPIAFPRGIRTSQASSRKIPRRSWRRRWCSMIPLARRGSHFSATASSGLFSCRRIVNSTCVSSWKTGPGSWSMRFWNAISTRKIHRNC
jgi:alginate O-acetyltransferase complex protein AlgJ